MSLTDGLLEAIRVLGADPDDDAAAVRRAYRRAVRQSPPDRDPERFQQIRAAYELLRDPVTGLVAHLENPLPSVPPPQAPPLPEPAPRGTAALALLRAMAGQLPVDTLVSPTDLEDEPDSTESQS